MNRLYPLLSDGLISILEDILEHNESKIASELLEAQRLIESYNSIGMFTVAYGKETKNAIERRINELVTDEVRALSIRRDVFEISFTPKGKELHYSSEGT